jgi:hypothetical protein
MERYQSRHDNLTEFVEIITMPLVKYTVEHFLYLRLKLKEEQSFGGSINSNPKKVKIFNVNFSDLLGN